MKKIFLIFLIGIFFATSQTVFAKSKASIGIMYFKSRVELSNVGTEKINIFETIPGLLKIGLQDEVEIIDLTTEVQKARLDEILTINDFGGLALDLKNLAEDYDCDYMLVGFLTNLSHAKDDKIIGKGDGIRASISVKIFETATGYAVATFTGRGVSMGRLNRIGGIFRSGQIEVSGDNLNDAVEKATEEVIKKLKKSLR